MTTTRQHKDPVALTAAWRIAAALVREYDGLWIEDGAGSTTLVVRTAGLVVAELDVTGKGDLRVPWLPPISSHEWAWPMPEAELRRLCRLLGRSSGALPTASPEHRRAWLTAKVIERVLSRHALTGQSLDVRGLGRDDDVLAWVDVDECVVGNGTDPTAPFWVVHVFRDVVGVLHDGWLYTAAGEQVDLFARYLGGASIEQLSHIVVLPPRR